MPVFSLLELKRYVDSKGYLSGGYKVPVNKLSKLKIPSIVLLDIGGYKHFVVLKGISEGRALIADPALGNKSMAIDEFDKAWNNNPGLLLLLKRLFIIDMAVSFSSNHVHLTVKYNQSKIFEIYPINLGIEPVTSLLAYQLKRVEKLGSGSPVPILISAICTIKLLWTTLRSPDI